jgi:hypothetical protein
MRSIKGNNDLNQIYPMIVLKLIPMIGTKEN